MKKQLFILIILLKTFQLSAQEKQSLSSANNHVNSRNNNECNSEQNDKKQTTKIENPHAFRIAPLNILNLNNPNFQIGYEYLISKKYSFQVDMGLIATRGIGNFLAEMFAQMDHPKTTNKGILLKTSVKYVLKDKRTFKLSISPEFIFLRNKSKIHRVFRISDPDFNYPIEILPDKNSYFHFLNNDEQKIGINFKVGFKILLGKKYYIEPHTGLGIVSRKVVHTGHYNPDDKFLTWGFIDKASINKWGLSLPINVVFAHRF